MFVCVPVVVVLVGGGGGAVLWVEWNVCPTALQPSAPKLAQKAPTMGATSYRVAALLEE